jgi:PEP-CTERM motif
MKITGNGIERALLNAHSTGCGVVSTSSRDLRRAKGQEMTTKIRRIFMILAAAVLLPCLAQTASADTVAKFGCGIVNVCGGGPITVPGPPYVATGANAITNLLTNVGSGSLSPFTFAFDTGAGTASLIDKTNALTGIIVTPTSPTTTGTTTGISFGVQWNLTSAPDIANFFASIPNFGAGVSQVSFETLNGNIDFASVTISPSPVPEPGTIALLGTGLLLCGRLLRKKKEDGDEAAA